MNESNLQQRQEIALREQERGIAAANQNSSIARVVNIVYFLFGVLQVLLGIRLVLHLIGANEGNAFAAFINTLSLPFVALFAGLVQNPVLSGTSVLEITTIIAMVAYSLLAWLIGRILWLVLSRPR